MSPRAPILVFTALVVPMEIEDLLRHDPVQTDIELDRRMVRGRTVLVTGAGGSIGSELCRQLVFLEPLNLILLGHGENPIFEILHELPAEQPRPGTRRNVGHSRD